MYPEEAKNHDPFHSEASLEDRLDIAKNQLKGSGKNHLHTFLTELVFPN